MDEDSPVGGDDTSEYEIYGTTPPRTKQRRNRERKQRNRDSGYVDDKQHCSGIKDNKVAVS